MKNLTNLLARYRATINALATLDPHAPELLIERSGGLACHYAPFDHVNTKAKVVLLGLTPGEQQARNAITALRSALDQGLSDQAALQLAKETASFSGPMRTNLVAMLDHLGLHRRLGIGGCSHLFDSRTDLVHFTSTLRYPVFADGKNYSGSPSVLGTPFLRSMCERWLTEEVAALSDAWWIPLGAEAKAVLAKLAAQGIISVDQVLDGMPHPSGENAERIAYFLGTRRREALSAKTNPESIDAAKRSLQSKLDGARVLDTAANTSLSALPLQKTQEIRDPSSSSIADRANGKNRFATTFVLRDYQGRSIHPVRSRRGTFTLAPRGANVHHAEHAIHVAEEEEAYQMVASGTYKIRAVREEGQSPSLLGAGDRAVKAVERISS